MYNLDLVAFLVPLMNLAENEELKYLFLLKLKIQENHIFFSILIIPNKETPDSLFGLIDLKLFCQLDLNQKEQQSDMYFDDSIKLSEELLVLSLDLE